MKRKTVETNLFTGKIPLGAGGREATVSVTCTIDLPPDITAEETAALRKFSLTDALTIMRPVNSPRIEAILASIRKNSVTTVGDYLNSDPPTPVPPTTGGPCGPKCRYAGAPGDLSKCGDNGRCNLRDEEQGARRGRWKAKEKGVRRGA